MSLHNRSAYSFGTSLITPQQLVEAAVTYRMPAVALADLNGLYAAVQFQQLCASRGLRSLIGVELVVDGTVLILLAQSQTGYANVCRLVSLQQLHGDTTSNDDSDRQGRRPPQECSNAALVASNVCDHARDVICVLGRSRERGRWQQLALALRPAFADRLYKALELHDTDDAVIAREDAHTADRLGIKVVATCAARCLRPEQAGTLKALSSIGTLTLMDQPHPDKPVGQWHLRSPDQMQRLFRRRPDALSNTLDVAGRCDFTFDLDINRFPAFESPDGRTAVQHLRELCLAGCRRRYITEPPLKGIGGTRPEWGQVMARLDRELRIIDEVHYAEYFLVFHEIVQYCVTAGIETLARGSAADSLVCYALGVSHACPFRFDLPFDRFINSQRAKFSKLADIDLDLPWDRREQVIGWVYDRWGHDRVAMIGSANTYKTRAAVVELGKAFGLPPHEVHEASRRLRHMHGCNLAQAITESPEARDIPIAEEPYRTIIDMSWALSGLPRHWAMHPCGMVVSPQPLTDLVPVQRSPRGFLVAQYDMDAIEDLGFVKIDLLGQAGLSVLRDSVAEIKRTDGHNISLQADVDYADAETWEMIAGGNARGVHHIESPAMTSLLQQCNCRDIDCLTSVVAIIRPGAANQGKKDSFARRYQGVEQYDFVHAALKPILAGTYGLMVFEEHILQVATDFAGMDLGAADVLRRALNKQNLPFIARMKKEFYSCARQRGRTAHETDAVWSLLEGFCGFMFNKAHSAEYAVEAFQGAWLKRRWPAHYIAAILSNYRGFYAHSPTLPQILYVLEAHRMGIGFLPPCINCSRERFSVEYVDSGTNGRQPKIRIPVSHIDGLSEKFLERYLASRRERLFDGVTDFLKRCRPGQAETQLLLDAGAFDDCGASRSEMFWYIRKWFQNDVTAEPTLWPVPQDPKHSVPPVSLIDPGVHDVARREMELLGFPVSIDPLNYLGTDASGRCIDWRRYVDVSELHHYYNKRVCVCGLMVADRIDATQQGELMKFVSLGDWSGFVETILFPDVYRRFGYLTAAHPMLAASGVVKPFENKNGCVLVVENVSVPHRA